MKALLALHARSAIQDAGGLVAWDCRKAEAYGSLTHEDAISLAAQALEFTDTKLRDDVLLHLACHVPGSLAGVQAELVRRGVLYPGELFWRAPPDARDALLSALPRSASSLSVNHLLLCLAWCGDRKVQESFATWRERPPMWAAALRVPPSSYTLEAGWELTPSGGRRELCALDSCRLEKALDADADALEIALTSTERCSWADRPLTKLVDLPSDHRALSWLGLETPRLQIVACDQCVCFTQLFCELDATGSAHRSSFNVRPENLRADERWEALPSARMTTRRELMTPFWGHPFAWNGGASKLGGFPSWVQDAEYPRCPKCTRAMLFVGQIEISDLRPFSEGTDFMFVCADCRVGATVYQQT